MQIVIIMLVLAGIVWGIKSLFRTNDKVEKTNHIIEITQDKNETEIIRKNAERENKKVREKAELEIELIRKKSIEDLKLAQTDQNIAIHAALTDAGIIVNSLSLISIFIRSIGVLFIITSIVSGYFIATKGSFTFDTRIIWSIYLVCQFSGLYLAGYGKQLTTKSMQFFAIYLSIAFLIVTASIISAISGIINLKISENIIYLAAINSSGIAVLIYIERKAINLLNAVKVP
jgi:hypothetical protein